MQRRSLFALLPVAFAQSLRRKPEEHARQLDSLIPDLLRSTGVPGLAVSLVHNGEIAWSKGFGVRSAEDGQPVDSDTVFEAASLSKPAFAHVALQLVDAGKLGLDAPLSHYLPKPWVSNEPRLPKITARLVLSHTSGLPHGRPPGTPVALRFDPGARFAYSSNGLEYLKTVVEEITSQPLAQIMQDRLLKPLKMERSAFGWNDRFHANYARGHARNGRIGLSGNGRFLEATPEEKGRMESEYPEYRYPSASAGLYTTAADYARFVCAMFQQSRAVKEMLKPQIRLNDAISWGLGWGIESAKAGGAFWHWGDWGVYRNFIIGYPATRSGVVVLTNSFHGPAAYRRIITAVTGVEHPAFSWVETYRP